MSRREEEFKHRTSIFEGAYRAWSHLGGLEPDELEQKSAKDLDPVTYVLSNDSRPGANKKTKNVNDDGSARLDCPYEPLPRSGLSHPFVQAILAPWLGPNADNEAVELGLATLRTWWQHRRKGENKSSVKTLGTAKMRVVVDKYARHFFDLAHCLVVSDDAQPPRTLHIKLKQMSKERRESQGLSMMDDDDDISASVLLKSGGNTHPAATLSGVNENAPGGPLEQLHAAQNLQHFQGLSLSGNSGPDLNTGPLVNVKGKCIPGKIDLPGMVEAVSRHSNQLAHRGGLLSVLQSSKAGDGSSTSLNASNTNDPSMYGDPTTTPVVFQSRQGQHFFIVMNVNGITCAHCVKIVETVLKGCNGGKSPIVGLLDAAADRGLSCVVIQIDSPKNAKRIAFESARNLALVGYTALSKEISTNMVTSSSSSSPDQSAMSNATKLESIQKAMMKLNQAYPFELFEFPPLCSCPDSGVFRENCPRYECVCVLFETWALLSYSVSKKCGC
jgi:copper chaperone CopZ